MCLELGDGKRQEVLEDGQPYYVNAARPPPLGAFGDPVGILAGLYWLAGPRKLFPSQERLGDC